MHRRFFVTALAGMSLAAVFANSAVAGGAWPGCGNCRYSYQAAPEAPHRVVRFSEFDYYLPYPLVGCYPEEAPIRDWRGNWFWGTKAKCYSPPIVSSRG
jgi:hypothetical protein